MINYDVIGNALTSPPSNTCRVSPKQVLDYDKMAELINLHNPTIPTATAKSVIEALREEVMTQLLAGNTIKFDNFVSFVSTLPVKLAQPIDPLPANVGQISAKIPYTFRDRLRLNAEYNRTGYPVKSPAIIAGWDTNTDLNGWLRQNNPFKVSGANIWFDTAWEDAGLYIKTAAGVETKQSNFASISQSGVTFVPSYNLQDLEHVDLTVIIRTRYTENGQIRVGDFTNKIRTTNETPNLFSVGGGTAPVSVTSTTAEDATLYRFIATLRPDNVMTLALGTMTTMGSAIEVTADGEYTLTDGSVSFTADVTSLETLTSNVLVYGRYMQEVHLFEAA